MRSKSTGPKYRNLHARNDSTLSSDAVAGSIARAAARFGLGARVLRAAIKRGDVPAYSAGTKRLRVFFADVERWLRSTRVDPTEHARRRVEEVLEREAR